MPVSLTRRSAMVAGAVTTIAATRGVAVSADAPATFDAAAFAARMRLPFRHRQVFLSARVADGAVLGFMHNSLDAYEHGFGEGPGTLHAAAVLYSIGVALGLDDRAWRELRLADRLGAGGDRISAPNASDGNPFLRTPAGRTIGELRARNASFFVCANALRDLAARSGVDPAVLAERLLPGTMLVPAGVAAANALQEERFTLFVAA